MKSDDTSAVRGCSLPRIRNFEQKALGLFVHYGLYSQLGRGEWHMLHDGLDAAEYEKLAKRFRADRFSGEAIARLAKEGGMRYACLTTRHHEGFSLYDTRGLSDFDITHSPCGRDLVAEFVEACRRHGIAPFLYHTTLDWRWRSHLCPQSRFRDYLRYLRRSIEILCQSYGPIGGFWFDGNWSRDDVDWEEDALYSLIRRHQPEAIIVNNSGLSRQGAVGHRELDTVTFEQAPPGASRRVGTDGKQLAMECCRTLNRHWGYAPEDFNYMGAADAIHAFARCRRYRSNLLLNVGPDERGAVPPYEAELIRVLGRWVRKVGEPLYSGRPIPASCPEPDFVLELDGRLYYFAHSLPRRGDRRVVQDAGAEGWRRIEGSLPRLARGRWIDSGETVEFRQGGALEIHCEGFRYGINHVIRVAEFS